MLDAGGHTAEMLALVGQLDKDRYAPRTYVVASTDRMGPQKAKAAEEDFGSKVRYCIIPLLRMEVRIC